jgi:ketosteroid isomerase-like protein
MGLGPERLRDVFEREDLDGFLSLLDPQVSWTWWEDEPVCRNREEVAELVREQISRGRWGKPEIVAETGERAVIDPHPEPVVEWAPELHHVYTFRDDRIVRIEDYPNREAALKAAAPS